MVMISLSNPHKLFLSSSHYRNPVSIWPSTLTMEECKLLPTGLSLNLPRSVLRRMLSFSLETVWVNMPLSNNSLMILYLRNDPEYDHRARLLIGHKSINGRYQSLMQMDQMEALG